MKCFVYGILHRISPFSQTVKAHYRMWMFIKSQRDLKESSSVTAWKLSTSKFIHWINDLFPRCQWEHSAPQDSRGFTLQCLHSLPSRSSRAVLQRTPPAWAAATWDRARADAHTVWDTSNAACACLGFLKESLQFFNFFELRLGLGGYIHIYAFSGFFLTYFSLL